MIGNMLRKKSSKVIGVVTAFCFIANSAFAQMPVSFSSEAVSNAVLSSPVVNFAKQLSLPIDMGEVSSVYVPAQSSLKKDMPFIIHVQDAHAHELAQTKIKDILTHLKNQYGVELFGFEGAHTTLSPSVLHIADSPDTNLKIAQYLLEKGELTGGELFALEQAEKNLAGPNTHFEGIEDRDLYTRDLKLFRLGLKNREAIQPLIERLEAQISRMKSKAFSSDLMKFDREYQAFTTRDEKNILTFFNSVRTKAKEILGIDLSQVQNQRQYPQLVRLSHLSDESDKINQEGMKADVDRLMSRLETINEKRPSQNTKEYLDFLNAVSEGKAIVKKPYATYRESFEGLHGIMKANKISWNEFPQFRTYAKHLILEEELGSVELFDELSALVYAIESKMATSQTENELVTIAKDYELYKKVMRLEANRKEVDTHFVKNTDYLNRLESVYAQVENGDRTFSKEELTLLNRQMTIAKKFYLGAREREQAFVNHLLELASKYHVSRLAFVTGGYHTTGIQEELAKRGIAYATISPKMVSEEESNLKDRLSNLYEAGMLGRRQTIFDKSHILKEIMSLSRESYLELVGSTDYRVNPFLEAVVKVGLEDLAVEIKFDSEEALTVFALANGLQDKFNQNAILGPENVKVSLVPETVQPTLRISWAKNRAGYDVPARGLEQAAKKNLKAQAQAISESAASLGLAKKDEQPMDPTRRKLTFGIAGGLAYLKFFGLGGVVAFVGCQDPGGPRTKSSGSPAGPSIRNLDPVTSGTVTELPKATIVVNQQTGQTEQRALNPIALQKFDTQGTVIKGSTLFVNEAGVNALAMEVNWKLDPNDPLKTFSGGAFAAPAGTSIDLSSSTFDEITIFVKSDIPKLRLEIEDITSTPDKPVKVQINLDKANTGAGASGGVFYKIPFKELVDAFQGTPRFDRSKVKTISLVVDKDLAGSQQQVTFTWAIKGVNTPALPIQANPTPFAATEISDFSSQDRRPVVTKANGGNPAAFVLRRSPSLFTLNYVTGPGSPQQGISNEFSGALLFSQDFQTPEDNFDFLNSGKLTPPDKLRFNIKASTSTNLPDIKVVVVGRDAQNNKVRQEFLIEQVSTSNKGVEIDFATQLVGIDRSKIDQIEIITSQPFGSTQNFSGQLDIEMLGFIAPINLSVQNAVAPTATTNFNGLLVADVAGGSANQTEVVGETTNTFLWKHHTSAAQGEAFSVALLRRPTFVNSGRIGPNGQPIFIPEPFDISGLGSLRFNIDKNGLTGDLPQNFTIALTDANGVRQDFVIKDPAGTAAYNGTDSSINIDVNQANFPSGFDRARVTEIAFISSQTTGDTQVHEGQLRVTVQGVAFTFQTNAQGQVTLAQTTDMTAPASPASAFLGEIGGGTAETTVQFVTDPIGSTNPNDRFTDINYSVNVGTYSGGEINAGFDANNNPRLMNLSQAIIPSQELVLGIEFRAGSTLPDRTIIEIKDVNGRAYRTRIDGLQVGTRQSVRIPLLPPGTPGSKLPASFDLAQVRSINIVTEGPFVNSGGQTAKSGTLRVQLQGYASGSQVSVGSPFANGQITNVSSVSSTNDAKISVAAGSSAQTSVTQSGNQFTLRMLTSGTSPNSGFILESLTPGGRFNFSNANININVARSTTEVPQQFFARFVDNAGGFVDVPLSAGVLNLNVGETIFTNPQSLPGNQVNAVNIVRVEPRALQIAGDTATHDATVVVTMNGVIAQSLGRGPKVTEWQEKDVIGKVVANLKRGLETKGVRVVDDLPTPHWLRGAMQNPSPSRESFPDFFPRLKTTNNSAKELLYDERGNLLMPAEQAVAGFPLSQLLTDAQTAYSEHYENVLPIYGLETGPASAAQSLGKTSVEEKYQAAQSSRDEKAMKVVVGELMQEMGLRLNPEDELPGFAQVNGISYRHAVGAGRLTYDQLKQDLLWDASGLSAYSLGVGAAPALRPEFQIEFVDADGRKATAPMTQRELNALGTVKEGSVPGTIDISQPRTLEDLLRAKLATVADGQIDKTRIAKVDVIDRRPPAREFPDAFRIELKGIDANSLGKVLSTQTVTSGVGTVNVIKVQLNTQLIEDTAETVTTRIAPNGLSRRFVGFPEDSVTTFSDGLINQFVAEARAEEPTGEEPTLEARAQALLAKLKKVHPSLGKIETGRGLVVEIAGDRVPNQIDMAAIILATSLNPELRYRWAYTGEEVERAKAAEEELQSAKNIFTGRKLGKRVGIDIIDVKSPRELRRALEKIPVQVFNQLPGARTGKLGDFKSHVVWYGSNASLRLLDMAYDSSVRIENDLSDASPRRNADHALVLVIGGRVAVHTYAGLAPEDRAAYNLDSKEVTATSLIAELEQAFEAEVWRDFAVGTSA